MTTIYVFGKEKVNKEGQYLDDSSLKNLEKIIVIDVCTTNITDVKKTNVEILATSVNVNSEKASKNVGDIIYGV